MTRLTLQEAYEKVWKYYVVDRNKPGLLHVDTDRATYDYCYYMTTKGDKCSIGCLLSDPSVLMYTRYPIDDLMNGKGVTPDMDSILDEIRSIPISALKDLQCYHDEATNIYRRAGLDAFLSHMENSLEEFREFYCLDPIGIIN